MNGNDDGGRGFDRRSWIGAIAGGAAALGLLARPAGAQLAKFGGVNSARKLDPEGGLSVVLLGTGTPLPNPDRACASTLVVAGDKCVLVDAGRGFVNNFFGAGFNDADLTLFTHFHSDHYAEFGELLVTRTIYGSSRVMPVVGPAGTKQVIGDLVDSYALDDGYRKAHHGDKWSSDGMRVNIIEASPGVVADEGGLKITMFEVDHTPVKPAMGYRFDYKGKSVVISGDTKKAPQMTEMAKGADLLVHEAVNKAMIQAARKVGNAIDERMNAMADEMLQYHTDVKEVAEIARDAGVKKLALTHLVPSIPNNPAMERMFIRGMKKIYGGPIEVGRDGMEIKA